MARSEQEQEQEQEQERVAGGGGEPDAGARSWSPRLTIGFGVVLIACAVVLLVVTDDPTDVNSRLPLPIWLVDLVVVLVCLYIVAIGLRGNRRRG